MPGVCRYDNANWPKEMDQLLVEFLNEKASEHRKHPRNIRSLTLSLSLSLFLYLCFSLYLCLSLSLSLSLFLSLSLSLSLSRALSLSLSDTHSKHGRNIRSSSLLNDYACPPELKRVLTYADVC